MKLQTQVFAMGLFLLIAGCGNSELKDLSNAEINEIMVHVNEDDPSFVEKGIAFDSIITLAGFRELDDKKERIKAKLYFFGERTRGYFNLADLDNKNLQVFGKKVEGDWAIKCVTKLNMEEVGGYILWSPGEDAIWSNGHYNFQKGNLSWTKQNTDYDVLETW